MGLLSSLSIWSHALHYQPASLLGVIQLLFFNSDATVQLILSELTFLQTLLNPPREQLEEDPFSSVRHFQSRSRSRDFTPTHNLFWKKKTSSKNDFPYEP